MIAIMNSRGLLAIGSLLFLTFTPDVRGNEASGIPSLDQENLYCVCKQGDYPLGLGEPDGSTTRLSVSPPCTNLSASLHESNSLLRGQLTGLSAELDQCVSMNRELANTVKRETALLQTKVQEKSKELARVTAALEAQNSTAQLLGAMRAECVSSGWRQREEAAGLEAALGAARLDLSTSGEALRGCQAEGEALRQKALLAEQARDTCNTQRSQAEAKLHVIRENCKKIGQGLKLEPLGKGIYHFHLNKKSWSDARLFCKQNRMELLTAVPGTPEYTAIVKRVVEILGTESQAIESTCFYNGLTDAAQEGRFIFDATGRAPSSTDWRLHEPNNIARRDGDEDCVVIALDGGKTGWNDMRCHIASRFICEVPEPCVSQI